MGKQRMLIPLRVDHVIGLILLLLAGVCAWGAYTLDVSYFNGSIGPQHWGFILVGALTGMTILLLLFPTNLTLPLFENWSTIAVQACFISAIVLYALFLRSLGYMVCTFVFAFVMGILFMGKPIKSLLSAAILVLVVYGLFDVALGVSLPMGNIWK